MLKGKESSYSKGLSGRIAERGRGVEAEFVQSGESYC